MDITQICSGYDEVIKKGQMTDEDISEGIQLLAGRGWKQTGISYAGL